MQATILAHWTGEILNLVLHEAEGLPTAPNNSTLSDAKELHTCPIYSFAGCCISLSDDARRLDEWNSSHRCNWGLKYPSTASSDAAEAMRELRAHPTLHLAALNVHSVRLGLSFEPCPHWRGKTRISVMWGRLDQYARGPTSQDRPVIVFNLAAHSGRPVTVGLKLLLVMQRLKRRSPTYQDRSSVLQS